MYAFILTGSRQFPILTVIINSRWCSIVFIKGWPSSITTIVPQEGFIDETLLLGVVTTFFDFKMLMQHFLQTIPFVFVCKLWQPSASSIFPKEVLHLHSTKVWPTWSWKAESRWWFRFFNDHSEPHLSALFLVNQPGKLENNGRFAPPIPSQKKAGEQARYSEDVGGTTMFYRILGVKLQQYLGSDFCFTNSAVGSTCSCQRVVWIFAVCFRHGCFCGGYSYGCFFQVGDLCWLLTR